VLEQLQFSVCALGEHWSAEGLHNLLDGHILVRELVSGGTSSQEIVKITIHMDDDAARRSSSTDQTRPKAPIPTGCRSEYLEVISKVVPKICARTNSAILTRLRRW
jgi:hypothetical protein